MEFNFSLINLIIIEIHYHRNKKKFNSLPAKLF
jgi:hypothetical protein